MMLASRSATTRGAISDYNAIVADPRATNAERLAAAIAAAGLAIRADQLPAARRFYQTAQTLAAPDDGAFQTLTIALAVRLPVDEKLALLTKLLPQLTDAERRRVAREQYAVALAAAGRDAEVAKVWESMLAEATPALRTSIAIQFAQALLRTGEAERAAAVLAALHPETAELRASWQWTQAGVAERLGHRDEALAWYETVAREAQNTASLRAEAWLQAATLRLALDRPAIAADDVEQAAHLGANPVQLALRVTAIAERFNAADAEAYLSKWEKRFGRDAPAKLLLLKLHGQLAWRRGDRAAAKATFTQALALATEPADREWLRQSLAEVERRR